MDVGIGLPANPEVDRDALLEWSRRAERRGFASLGTIDRPLPGERHRDGFADSGADELIYFPSTPDPTQVDRLAEVVL